MNREEVPRLVAEVISQLAPRLGADGRRGRLVVAFSGATGVVPRDAPAVPSARSRRLSVAPGVLTRGRAALRLGRAGEPGRLPARGPRSTRPSGSVSSWSPGPSSCPMLSVNTLSKLSLLTADGLVPNLLLHGLFMGKPVVLARDGVDLADEGRRALGIDQATPALRQALDRSTAHGCRLRLPHHGRAQPARDGELRAGEPAALARRPARCRPGRSSPPPTFAARTCRRGTEPVPQVARDAVGPRPGDAARRAADPERRGPPVKRRERATTC